jgi:hypothetical protein
MHKVHSPVNGVDDESGSVRKRVSRIKSFLAVKAGKMKTQKFLLVKTECHIQIQKRAVLVIWIPNLQGFGNHALNSPVIFSDQIRT